MSILPFKYSLTYPFHPTLASSSPPSSCHFPPSLPSSVHFAASEQVNKPSAICLLMPAELHSVRKTPSCLNTQIWSTPTQSSLLLLFYYVFNLYERPGEKDWVGHSHLTPPNARDGCDKARQKPGDRNSIPVFQVGGRDRTTGTNMCCLLVSVLVGSWNWGQIWDSNSCTPTQTVL